MTVYLTNLTRDTQDHWNCVLSKACTWLNCTMAKTLYYAVTISQCSQSMTFTKGYTNGTVINRSTFSSSGLYSISDREFFSVVLQYSSRDGFNLEIQVRYWTTFPPLRSSTTRVYNYVGKNNREITFIIPSSHQLLSSRAQWLIKTTSQNGWGLAATPYIS